MIREYPEYKESGIDWLGKIPSHWEIFSLKRAFDSCINGVWGDEPDGLHDLIVLRVADFDRNKQSVSEDKLTLRSILPKDRVARLLKKGDLLIEKSGGGEKTLVGCVVKFDKDFQAVTSNFVAKMTPKKGFNCQFLNYCFAHLYAGNVNFPSIKQTTGIQNIDTESYLLNYASFPNQFEQEAIANFLDRETARIDKLIAEKQTFIKLLKEKRQALISHVVTKGLNPNVTNSSGTNLDASGGPQGAGKDSPRKMKDSGIEWIGEVPEHWVVKKIKYDVTSIEQGWSPQCESTPVTDGQSWAVVKVGCVNGGIFNALQNKKLPDELEPKPEYCIKKDDLLISRANAKEWVGSAAVAETDFPKLMLCDKIYRIRLNQNTVNPHFVAYYLGSNIAREQIEIDATGTSSSMLNIGQGTILDMPIAIPNLKEQNQIVVSLKTQTLKIENLMQEVQTSIAFLQEHRTALISAAVTGKIDVRNQ